MSGDRSHFPAPTAWAEVVDVVVALALVFVVVVVVVVDVAAAGISTLLSVFTFTVADAGKHALGSLISLNGHIAT